MARPFWRTTDEKFVKDANFSELFTAVHGQVSYKDGYGLLLAKDKRDPLGRWYFQVECERPDSLIGGTSIGRGGKAYLSPHMNESELVRLAFGLFRAYEEHECREFFKWRERAVFGPHISVEALWLAADSLELR